MNRIFLMCLLFLSSNIVFADMYKYVDSNGVINYTNVKPRNVKNVDLVSSDPTPPPATEKPAAKPRSESAKTPTPSDFPKVDGNTQAQRDSKRRDILMNELNQEKQALERSKQSYEDAKNVPEVYRNANGGINRNVAKYEEKLKAIQDEIDAHQRNIALLNKELGL